MRLHIRIGLGVLTLAGLLSSCATDGSFNAKEFDKIVSALEDPNAGADASFNPGGSGAEGSGPATPGAKPPVPGGAELLSSTTYTDLGNPGEEPLKFQIDSYEYGPEDQTYEQIRDFYLEHFVGLQKEGQEVTAAGPGLGPGNPGTDDGSVEYQASGEGSFQRVKVSKAGTSTFVDVVTGVPID